MTIDDLSQGLEDFHDGMVNGDFWRNKRVLLTGHSGFKGSWLALWLERLGAQTTGLGLEPPTTPSLADAVAVDGRLTRVDRVDVRDLSGVRRSVERAEPEIVLHLAAQTVVRTAYAEPVLTFDTNVMGTVNVLEALREMSSVQAVVIVTSDKCYLPFATPHIYREDDPLGGSEPYGCSKAGAELVAAAYRESFMHQAGVPVATARAGNVIGGGDWAKDRLVPDLMRAGFEGRTAMIRNPNATRPWQHVLCSLDGYLTLAQTLVEDSASAGAWNFGPSSDAWPVRRLADRIAELWPALSWQETGDSGPAEAPYLGLSSEKARTGLGWCPPWALEEGLEMVVSWYRQFADGADAASLALEQIAVYERDTAAAAVA